MRVLQRMISSVEFTELMAYARRHTLSPDLCRTMANVGASLCEVRCQPEDFMPIVQDDDPETRTRLAAQAEAMLDRGLE